MSLVTLKTTENNSSIEEFIENIKNTQQKKDSQSLIRILKDVTGYEPKMWGSSIVGFGNEHLKYKSGRELEWFKIGFSPRKQYLTIYISGALNEYKDLLNKLGNYTTGKSCIYIKSLTEIDIDILKQLVTKSINK